EGMPGVAYRWMEVVGQVPDLPWPVTPSNPADAERFLRQFMKAASRRPPAEDEVRRYLKIVTDRLGSQPSNEAMIAGYVAVLCSPGFLYLEEQPGPLDGYALASRLSYFLWNGSPDETLRSLTANNTLWKPDVLRAQVNRLLDNPN